MRLSARLHLSVDALASSNPDPILRNFLNLCDFNHCASTFGIFLQAHFEVKAGQRVINYNFFMIVSAFVVWIQPSEIFHFEKFEPQLFQILNGT